MCKSIPGTQKHMTMDQRIMIEKGLDQGRSLREYRSTVRKRSNHNLQRD